MLYLKKRKKKNQKKVVWLNDVSCIFEVSCVIVDPVS